MITDPANLIEDIVLTEMSDDINICDLQLWLSKLATERISHKHLKVLVDAKTASYTFDENEIIKLKSNFVNLCAKFQSVTIAIVHETPNETALSIIIEQRMNIENYSQRIFSEMATAMNWLR
jgi:hypothetical protein